MSGTITETSSDTSSEVTSDFTEVHVFCNVCMGPDANGFYTAICGYKRKDPRWKPKVSATCAVCTDPAMQHRVSWHGKVIWTS